VYGGAGAIQGPLLAAELGINRVLVPSAPSVFCALGGLVSELSHDSMETVHGTDVDGAVVGSKFARLRGHAVEWLSRQVAAEHLISTTFECWAEMRYVGQSFQVDVRLPDKAVETGDLVALEEAFHREHERVYSHCDRTAPVEFVNLRVRVRGGMLIPEPSAPPMLKGGEAVKGMRSMRFQGKTYPDVRIYERALLSEDTTINGPAVIEQPEATIVVPPDYSAEVGAYGSIFMTRS
ncbi:hydantoinase/oxoprolinase family protein, partial [Mesorhizobium sp. M5C.F.Ca.IN.020.14.1.1]